MTITPQSRVETTVHKDWKLSEFSRRTETRSLTVQTKYGLHDISFQAPVSSFRWDIVEIKRTTRDVTLDPLRSSRVVELLPPIRMGINALADRLDGKAMEHYAAAKKNAHKVGAYRDVIEDALKELQEGCRSQQNALQRALSTTAGTGKP